MPNRHNSSSMDSLRLSKKSKLYLTLFVVVLVQFTFLERVRCRKQDPTNENVSAKSRNEKETNTETDDNNDSLVAKKDSETEKKKQDMSSSNLIENVTDKVDSSGNTDKDTLTSSANQTKTKDTQETDQTDNATDESTSKEASEDNSDDEEELDDEDLRSGQDYQYVLEKIYQLSEKRQSLSEYRSKLSDRSSIDIATSMTLLKEAADLGYDIAKLVLAKIYFYGDFVPQNFDQAYRLFHELSLKGNGDAHLVCIMQNFYSISKTNFVLFPSILVSCIQSV